MILRCVRCLPRTILTDHSPKLVDQVPADVLVALTVYRGNALCMNHLVEAVKEDEDLRRQVRADDSAWQSLGRGSRWNDGY